MADQPAQADRFKPEMPRIPGVNDGAHASPPSISKPFFKLVILAVAILAVLGGAAWHFHASANKGTSSSAAAPAPPAALVEPAAIAPPPLPTAPGPVATMDELAQPWSARSFNFVRPDTHAVVRAMVIRLPGITGNRSGAYWAFAIAQPFGRCDLNYVTDIKQLSTDYAYPASHPMLVAACNGTLYDPLRMGVIPNGAWTRGEVVQGPGIRPPTAIRIQVSGQTVIADRIE